MSGVGYRSRSYGRAGPRNGRYAGEGCTASVVALESRMRCRECDEKGRVAISIHTHKIDGLAEADCILAARIDRIHAPSEARP